MAESEAALPACGKCAMHLYSTPFLGEAFASVGIEHGKSAAQMCHEYLQEHHRLGHPEDSL